MPYADPIKNKEFIKRYKAEHRDYLKAQAFKNYIKRHYGLTVEQWEGVKDLSRALPLHTGKIADIGTQKRMFGETVYDMERMKPSFITNIFYAFMILSDAQEVMKINRGRANQFINKAKFFMAKELETQEGVVKCE